MSTVYVVRFYGFVYYPIPGLERGKQPQPRRESATYFRESRIESEPMTLDAALKFRDQLAEWHVGRPVDFTLEPVIYKRTVNDDGATTYEEIP